MSLPEQRRCFPRCLLLVFPLPFALVFVFQSVQLKFVSFSFLFRFFLPFLTPLSCCKCVFVCLSFLLLFLLTYLLTYLLKKGKILKLNQANTTSLKHSLVVRRWL